MPMQGISPPGEKKVISIATIGAGADTTVCMMGGRFCVFTVKNDNKLTGDVTIDLRCGGEDTNLIPTSANKTVTIEATSSDYVASIAVDMGGYQSFVVDSITGISTGTLVIEPVWC